MAADPVFPVPSLTFEIQRSGDTQTAICHGRVVAETVPNLQDEVRRMIAESRNVVLDLGDVAYADSSGLGALVGLYVSAKRAGKQLTLINLNGRVRELLRLTRLLNIFETHGGNR
jgi:anti-anti-sigma factor